MKLPKFTEAEISDHNLGGCTSCGATQDGCEPDARGYICQSCGQPTVFGAEELVIMGKCEVVAEEDDDLDD